MSDQKKKAPKGSRNRKGIKAEMEVPVNLERVLIEAGKDLAFYQALVSDCARALADRGYRLRASEQAMLSAMPRHALQKMIEQLRPEKLAKSRFARKVATAVAGTVLFSTSACDSSGNPPPPASTGITPEYLADANNYATQGITPDFPDAASTGGIEGTGGVGGSELPDASPDGSQAGTGGESVWQADTGPITVDAGVSPGLLDANSQDSGQLNDADSSTWEADGETVTRGITPDFPIDAADNSNDSENQGEN